MTKISKNIVKISLWLTVINFAVDWMLKQINAPISLALISGPLFLVTMASWIWAGVRTFKQKKYYLMILFVFILIIYGVMLVVALNFAAHYVPIY